MDISRVPYILQPPTSHSYWTERIIKGMEQEANKKRLPLIAFESVQDLLISGEKPREVLLIGYSSQWFRQAADILRATRIEPVFVSAYRPMDERFSSLCFSMPGAIEEMLFYLRSDGKSHIAFVGYNPDSPADMAKAKAFDRITHEFGLTGCELFPCRSMSMSDCVSQAVSRARRFDAIMCANDPVAILAIDMLRKQNICVPEDIYVTGSGNMILSALFDYPVTTIDFDYVQLGRQAVRLYTSIALEDSDLRHQRFLPCKLVIRQSTNYFSPTDSIHTDYAIIPEEVQSYYADEKISRLNHMEEVLQQCDEWDLQIIKALLHDASYEELASMLHFSERAIKYRVRNLCALVNVKSKSELSELLKSYC